jgi:hypothetical protein
MTALITILISLLGYGTPAEFENLTEEQVKTEITLHQNDGGVGDLDIAG